MQEQFRPYALLPPPAAAQSDPAIYQFRYFSQQPTIIKGLLTAPGGDNYAPQEEADRVVLPPPNNEMILAQKAEHIVRVSRGLTKRNLPTLQTYLELGFTQPRLQAVVNKLTSGNRGAHAAIHFSMEAVLATYNKDELLVIAQNNRNFRSFMSTLDDVVHLYNEFKDREFSISYKQAFHLYHHIPDRAVDLLEATITWFDDHDLQRYKGDVLNRFFKVIKIAQETGCDPETVLNLDENLGESDETEQSELLNHRPYWER